MSFFFNENSNTLAKETSIRELVNIGDEDIKQGALNNEHQNN
jgi:hypothetical protein